MTNRPSPSHRSMAFSVQGQPALQVSISFRRACGRSNKCNHGQHRALLIDLLPVAAHTQQLCYFSSYCSHCGNDRVIVCKTLRCGFWTLKGESKDAAGGKAIGLAMSQTVKSTFASWPSCAVMIVLSSAFPVGRAPLSRTAPMTCNLSQLDPSRHPRCRAGDQRGKKFTYILITHQNRSSSPWAPINMVPLLASDLQEHD